VGLIQREIEQQGIPTIGISIVRRFSEQVRPPRTVFLPWPFGHPLGEPFYQAQQMAVLRAAFEALYAIQRPGEILDLPFRWKRETFPEDPFAGVTADAFRPAG
jgi:D-proline reductase (dithiol) PrdB